MVYEFGPRLLPLPARSTLRAQADAGDGVAGQHRHDNGRDHSDPSTHSAWHARANGQEVRRHREQSEAIHLSA